MKRNRLTGSAPKEGQFLKRELERLLEGIKESLRVDITKEIDKIGK